MSDIQEFIKDLLIEAGFDPADHHDMIEELEPIVLKRIISKLVLKLSPVQRDEAENCLSTANSEAFWSLCQKNIPNYEEYFVQILAELQEEYLSNFK